MTNGNINNLLIPNVSKLPGQKKASVPSHSSSEIEKSEFKQLLNKEINNVQKEHGIQISLHAAKRLKERNLDLDNEEYFKLKGAMDKLREKGGQDSLVVTGKAAYIVDIPNNKVVTAIDKSSMAENVFTKIDSTLIVG
jgi:flagellar operon protein